MPISQLAGSLLNRLRSPRGAIGRASACHTSYAGVTSSNHSDLTWVFKSFKGGKQCIDVIFAQGHTLALLDRPIILNLMIFGVTMVPGFLKALIY